MSIYIAIYAALTLFALFEAHQKNARHISAITTLTFLLIFVGSRKEVGCDFKNYSDKYEYSEYLLNSSKGIFDIRSNEYGYLWLNNVFSSNGLDIVWFNLFVSFVFVCGLFTYLSRIKNPSFIIAVIFPFVFIGLAMSGVRQTLALAFFLLGLAYLLQGRWAVFTILVVAGSFFHASVIFLLPLAVIGLAGRGAFWTLAILVFLGPIGFALTEDRVELYSQRYIQGDIEAAGAIIRSLIISIPGFIYFAMANKIQIRNPYYHSAVKFGSILAISIVPLTFAVSVAGERLAPYVAPISAFVMVYIFSSINKDWRILAKITSLVIVGSYLISWFSFSVKAQQCYVPYQSFIFSA